MKPTTMAVAQPTVNSLAVKFVIIVGLPLPLQPGRADLQIHERRLKVQLEFERNAGCRAARDAVCGSLGRIERGETADGLSIQDQVVRGPVRFNQEVVYILHFKILCGAGWHPAAD